MIDKSILHRNSKHKNLLPSDVIGFAYFFLAVALTVTAIILSNYPFGIVWLIGQLLFALAFLEWFIILHEAGHRTLFRRRLPNVIVGTIAGIFAMIPFSAWRQIHARHHVWTGWQDMDATTATLVARPLAAWEKLVINVAWRSGIPLFSVLYRLQNYWNPRRLQQFLAASVLPRIRIESMLLLLIYAVIALWFGPWQLASTCGVGLLLALVIQDPLLLSQHTHMPSHLSHGKAVRPFSHSEQEAFTRSLRFPFWISLLIMHFDAHELHHMFVRVPGYRLRHIVYHPSNEVGWWQWLRAAKKLTGVDFLFGRRDKTGFPF